ncbi:F-actin-capping protein subunit beta [Rhodotorula paludigena]|uniref:F-actin-capping protein subunit beta n=1 Tax=Rhodotorula paludigena TaxID=86838 RepID=UPI003182856C
MDDALTSALDLVRRLPPSAVAHTLDRLAAALPDCADDLAASVDVPLAVRTDTSHRDYLACDYNRDADSYRSPYTNEYDPPLADGTTPSPPLRELELAMNDAFNVYRDLYYEGGVSSVYLWDTDEGFAGVVLIKKTSDAGSSTSSWDSVHVFESSSSLPSTSSSSSSSASRTSSHYKLTSTVMLHLEKPLRKEGGQESAGAEGARTEEGEVALGGSMTRQHELTCALDPSSATTLAQSHLANVGRLVEDMELKLRNLLGEVYFSKTKDVLGALRSQGGLEQQNRQRALQGELVGLLKGRKVAA